MLCSCSSPGGDGFGGQIGINQDAGGGDDKQEPFDDENAPADEPTQISGAFLSMAFDETLDDTQKSIRDNPKGKVRIAACLRDKKTLQCVDMTGLSFQWELVTADRRYLPIEWTTAPKTYDFAVVLSIPVQHLAGTVLVRIDDRVSGKDAMRARTLTSVGEFGAKFGRAGGVGGADGGAYDAREEAAELGLPLAPSERLGQEAQVEVVGVDEAAAEVVDNDDDDEQGFWALVMGVIKDIFGEVYTVPVTTITTEPVVPCSTCGESMQFIVPPAQQIRPDASSISNEPPSADATLGQPTAGDGGGGGWTKPSSPDGSPGAGGAGGWEDGVWKPGSTPSTQSPDAGASPADPAPGSGSGSQQGSSEDKPDGGLSSPDGSDANGQGSGGGTAAGDQGAGGSGGGTTGGDQGTGGTGGTAGDGQSSGGTGGGTVGDGKGSGSTTGADQGSGSGPAE
jgi:hypothetical protein